MQRESLKTEGIIIKRINYRDADKILTIFTKDLGKISCIAKGIRKIESKKRSHLEPFNQVDIFLIKTGNMYLITQAQSVHIFQAIKGNIELSQLSMILLEIIERTMQDHEMNKTIYSLLIKTLEFLNKTQDQKYIIAFMVKNLKINGFYSKKQMQQFIQFQAVPSSNDYLKILNKIEDQTYEELEESTFDNDQLEILFNVLKEYFKETLDINLKTKWS